MVKYLVFDFETNGINKDAANGYKPYSEAEMALPRENYPVELSYSVLDETGVVTESEESILIRGATRFNPWVIKNCPHLDVDKCNAEGVEFSEALRRLALAAEGCTLVAHNIDYDWNDVIVATADKKNPDFLKLKSCTRFCTCINPTTKANKSSYFFKKIGKWIGPSLEKLAAMYTVAYEPTLAHKASYDVAVVVECLREMNKPKKRAKTANGSTNKKSRSV